jgi:type IV pilus assembly protein PilW
MSSLRRQLGFRLRLQRGATIAELLIALTLGLLVTLLCGSILIMANGAFVAQTEAANVADAGRFALAAIERAALQSGFINFDRAEAGHAGDPATAAPIAGLDDHTLARASAALADPRSGAVNGSDVLALRFAGSGPEPDGDGSVINCAGFSVSDQHDGWSIFYVARNAQGVAELRCKYRGKSNWNADAVIGGVDSFQVLYGHDTDTPPDGSANHFITARALDALDQTLELTGDTEAARGRELHRKTHWKRVVSLKVALVLHGAGVLRGPRELAVFDLFGPAYSAAQRASDPGTQLAEADLPPPLRRRERQAFSTTIALRNWSGAPE